VTGAALILSTPVVCLLWLLFDKQSVGPAFAAVFTGVCIATATMWALVIKTEYAPFAPVNAYMAMTIVMLVGTAFPLVMLWEQVRLFVHSPWRYLWRADSESGEPISHI